MSTNSPSKFVKPADLFRMRNSSSSSPAFEAQSPLKCLNNLTDPSPTKKLPTLLRNPFNRPTKRRLNLGSPNKRTRMFEIDEDANLEPPKMKQMALSEKKVCFRNDWILRTKFKISFDKHCRNWNKLSTSTHKRTKNSPSKLTDKTISIEAIKNAATVYQHPYLAWLPLYPRVSLEFDKKKDNLNVLMKQSEVSKMIRKDWCESLEDLCNLLIDGKCPYFYVCADNYNILFKHVPSSNSSKPLVQAYITPLSYGMDREMIKSGIEFKSPQNELTRNNSSSNNLNMVNKETSQHSFGSSRTTNTQDIDDSSSQVSDNNKNQNNISKVTSSIDSGNLSDLEDDDDFNDDENEDASHILESFGLSQQDFPTLQSKRKGFIEADSNTQTKVTSNKPLASIEGSDSIRKLVKFLQENELYTITNMGRFACIPPTLLSPSEFRLSTPQYPEVILSKNMIETFKTDIVKNNVGLTQKPGANVGIKTPTTPKKTDIRTNQQVGPTFVELKGTILPSFYKELHKLLSISDNISLHKCQSTTLESSIPLENVQLLP